MDTRPHINTFSTSDYEVEKVFMWGRVSMIFSFIQPSQSRAGVSSHEIDFWLDLTYLDQVDGNLQKCVWYANLRVGRASYANLNRRSRIQIPFSVVVCWYHVRLRILHRLSYCLTQDTHWTSTTGVKQCTFHWLISSDIVQNKMVLNILIIHHLIIITCISHEIMFTISLPKLINTALL